MGFRIYPLLERIGRIIVRLSAVLLGVETSFVIETYRYVKSTVRSR